MLSSVFDANGPPMRGTIDTTNFARRAPLSVQITAELGRSIIEGKLRPGDSLPSEAELSEQFGVSTRVIRDSLRMLSNYGVIETSQGRRATVSNLKPVAMEAYFRFATQIGRHSIVDLFEIRMFLETQAARLAAERATTEAISQIRDQLDKMRDAVADDDVEMRVDADLEYHKAIVRAAGNGILYEIIDALSASLRTERKGLYLMRVRLEETEQLTLAEHAKILEAIEKRNPDRSESLMAQHLGRVQEWVSQHLRASGEVGPPQGQPPGVSEP